jgi:precorrin-6Y C5,15-methyltransferase (decarboxylating)
VSLAQAPGGAPTITVLGLPRHFDDADLTDLSRADLVAGDAQHLRSIGHMLTPRATELTIGEDTGTLLARLATAGHPVVLAPGDPGHFGIVRALAARFGPERIDVRPGVPAVAAAFAAAGLPWDDARVVTAQGWDPSAVLAVCRRFPKVAVLTGPRLSPAGIARGLAGVTREMFVAEDLHGPHPRVTRAMPDAVAWAEWSLPGVVLVVDPAHAVGAAPGMAPPRATATAWALDDRAFDGTVAAGAEARALILAWLGPGPGDLLWDVGAGGGSVAVEAARLGAAAIAIDRDGGQCDRARANSARHDVPVEVVEGQAPAALAALPDPDIVFVGGGGTSVVLAAAERARRAVVTALSAVERVGPVHRALDDDGWEVDATLLSASRLASLPTGHRLAPQPPIFLVAGRRP